MAMTPEMAEKLCARDRHCWHDLVVGFAAACCWCGLPRNASPREMLLSFETEDCPGEHGGALPRTRQVWDEHMDRVLLRDGRDVTPQDGETVDDRIAAAEAQDRYDALEGEALDDDD